VPLFEIKVNTGQIRALEVLFEKVGAQKVVAIRRALNRVGDQLYTRTIKVVAKQVGTTQRSIRKYMIKKRVFAGARAVYRIVGEAPAMSLKEFSPRQTPQGVSAAPWGHRRIFKHSFISAALGGHVFVREIHGGGRAGRLPIRKLWGPVLANELVRGGMEEEHKRATEELSNRIAHEIDAILQGYAPRGKI
jgi:hypothetical protein